ncbi:RDD family protein [Zhouia sp. PK063]|uniref:RDD family protein n=1 Tax=Zhouia sp. PK063 TaxID=3373602 RepID=UPI0037A533B4
MAELQINTTQNVAINFGAASVGERILAYLIDLTIKIAYILAFALLYRGLLKDPLGIDNLDMWSKVAVNIIIYLPVIFYTLILETWLEGQTIGKKVMQIKVVKIDGFQASFGDYLIRWMFRIVDIDLVSGMIAVIAIAISNKSQRIGDMAAGTSVITLKNNVALSHTIAMHLKDDYQPKYPSVIRLSDNDARIIKETFKAALHTDDTTTILKLKIKIEEVIGVTAEEKNIKDFVVRVLKDYNYYTQNM